MSLCIQTEDRSSHLERTEPRTHLKRIAINMSPVYIEHRVPELSIAKCSVRVVVQRSPVEVKKSVPNRVRFVVIRS